MKQLGVLLLSLDGRSPSILSGCPNSSPVPIHSRAEIGTVRVKCLAQEYDTATSVSARTWSTIGTDHLATALRLDLKNQPTHLLSMISGSVILVFVM